MDAGDFLQLFTPGPALRKCGTGGWIMRSHNPKSGYIDLSMTRRFVGLADMAPRKPETWHFQSLRGLLQKRRRRHLLRPNRKLGLLYFYCFPRTLFLSHFS